MDAAANNRDAQGRFLVGNPGGPGRPPGKVKALRRAAEESVQPEHIEAIMRRATRMALEGNLAAMRFVIERTCGRAPDAPPRGAEIDLVLPEMATGADCNRALDVLGRSVCDGSVDRDGAKVLIDIVQTRLRAIELQDVERRLSDLEQQASNVDLSQNGRRH